MDLEKVTAQIRPRRGWEAIDLGISLVQQHARVLYKLWFLVSLPVFLIIIVGLYSSPGWAALCIWWLLPLLERPLLHFLSRELFGESLAAGQCAKAFFSVAKIQWFASLTWRRLSFTRSLDLPLIQLENLASSKRASRLKTLHSGDSGSAVWLTIIFFIIEIIFFVSFITLFYMLVPETNLENNDIFSWIRGESETDSISHFSIVLGYFCISLVAPFYVACGFSLYINQRTHLEAWDIELSFKRLASRLKEKSANLNIRLASLIFCLSFTLSTSLSSFSVEAQQQSTTELLQVTSESELIGQDENITVDNDLTHQQIKTIATDIKEGNDFHQKVQQETHQYRSSTDGSWFDDDEPSSISPGWVIFAKLFAMLIEFALWIFIAVLIIFLVIKYKHLLGNTSFNKKIKQKRPQKLFGLDLDSESLPEQPWKVARSLVEKEQFRQALSLLYRASLIWYIDNRNVVIKEGYTELECLSKIIKNVGIVSQGYIKKLTNVWRGLAYAHALPEKSVMLDLCDNWPKVMQVNSSLLPNSTNKKVATSIAGEVDND